MNKPFRLLIFFISIVSAIHGQRLGFKNFSTDNGLSSNSILCLFQDENNLLWIGSNPGGIDLYNGYEFKSDSLRLKLGTRTVYHIDKYDGSYYFATNNGLKIYDGDSTFTYNEENGLKSFRAYKTLKDSNGKIWIATQKGVQTIKNNKLTKEVFNSALDSVTIYNIYEDSKGTIWFCSLFNGLFKYDGKETKQYDIDKKEGYKFACDIIEISDGKYWVSTRGGLYEFKNDSLTRINVLGLSTVQYYGITRDSKGNIWIGSDEGVFVYRNNKFTRFTTKNGLIDNTIWNIYEDNENTLWFISNLKGMSQLNSEKFSLFEEEYIGQNEVFSIFPKSDSVLFLGLKDKLIEFNINSYASKKIFGSSINHKAYSGTYDKDNDEVLIGQYFGATRLKNDNVIKEYETHMGERALAKIWRILKDKDGKEWLGTAKGIAYFHDDKILKWEHPNNINTHVFDILEHPNGDLFFATELGLFSKKGNDLINISKEKGFSNKRIRQISFDKDYNLWIASASGLFKYDGTEFHEINYKKVKDDVILSIAFDNERNLWAGLPTGALKIQFADNDTNFTIFSQQEGFIGNDCNNHAIWVSPTNEVYFGTNAGLTVYHPSKDYNHKIKPHLHVAMRVQGLRDLSEYCDGFDKNGLPINLVLPSNFTEISFENNVTSLRKSGRIQLEYKFKGSKHWKTTFDDLPVLYSKLPSDNFTYIVRIKQDGKFVETKPIHIKFKILKPFYLRWWFILICLAIAGTWIYSYIIIKKNIKTLNKQQKIILNQKHLVEEKNREIVDSITYAKRIQDTILPDNQSFQDHGLDYFVLYTPRDIVSGDFYWIESQNDWVVFAAADCTGHGVPGAMVSMLCSNLLRKAIVEERVDDPGEALDLISSLLLKRMHTNNESVDDGMDLTLCYWNPKLKKLKFAGANNPLYLIRENELHITKADKQPIGYFEDRKPFTSHQIDIKEGDQIIIFSDGLKDQFGGPKNKKYSTKRFKNTLLDNSNLPMEVQEEKLLLSFRDWMGNEEQVDDICVFSVKF